MASRHHLFTTDESALPHVRAWLRSAIGPVAARPEGYQFIQAVDELCSNIVEHADQRPDQFGRNFQIKLHTEPHLLEAELVYAGDDFDLTAYVPKNLEEILSKGIKGGIGIRLIGTLSSKVKYKRVNGVNVCTIAKVI